jgi:hypothetical protein
MVLAAIPDLSSEFRALIYLPTPVKNAWHPAALLNVLANCKNRHKVISLSRHKLSLE